MEKSALRGRVVSNDSVTTTTYVIEVTGPEEDRAFTATGPSVKCFADTIEVTVTGTATTFERVTIQMRGASDRFAKHHRFQSEVYDSHCKTDPSLNLIELDAPRWMLKVIDDALPPYVLVGAFGSDNWGDVNAPARSKFGLVQEGDTIIVDGTEVEVTADEQVDVLDPEVDASRENMRKGGKLEYLYYTKFTFAGGMQATYRSDAPVLVKRRLSH
jgi:hypothetical protein